MNNLSNFTTTVQNSNNTVRDFYFQLKSQNISMTVSANKKTINTTMPLKLLDNLIHQSVMPNDPQGNDNKLNIICRYIAKMDTTDESTITASKTKEQEILQSKFKLKISSSQIKHTKMAVYEESSRS